MKKKISVILLSAIFSAQAANAGYVYKIKTIDSAMIGSGSNPSTPTTPSGSSYDSKSDAELVDVGVAKGGTSDSDKTIADLATPAVKADNCNKTSPRLQGEAGVVSYDSVANKTDRLALVAGHPFYGGLGRYNLNNSSIGSNPYKVLKSGVVADTGVAYGPSRDKAASAIPPNLLAFTLQAGKTIEDYSSASNAEKEAMLTPLSISDFAIGTLTFGSALNFSSLIQVGTQYYYIAASDWVPEVSANSYWVFMPLSTKLPSISALDGKRLIHNSSFLLSSDGSVSVIRSAWDGTIYDEPVAGIKFSDAFAAPTQNSNYATIGLTTSGQLYELINTGLAVNTNQIGSGVVKLINNPQNRSSYISYIKSDGSMYVYTSGSETKIPKAPAGYTFAGILGDLAVSVSKNKVAIMKVFDVENATFNADTNFLDDSMESKESLKVKAKSAWVYSKDVCDL